MTMYMMLHQWTCDDHSELERIWNDLNFETHVLINSARKIAGKNWVFDVINE